jgi:cobalt-precorrin-7 (C5)-methyltransferase
MLYIIGVGPGDHELITIKGLNAVMRCPAIAGWSGVLSRFKPYIANKLVIELNYRNEEGLLRRIMEIARVKDVCFLMHGDPSVSERQLMVKLRTLANEYGVSITVIPGVSSITRALSIVGKDLADIIFITLHERNPDFEELSKYVGLGRDLLVFPPPYRDGIAMVAKELLKHLGFDHEVYVLENLTLSTERVTVLRLGQLLNYEASTDLVILYVPLKLVKQ